jgi:hypothetical protein
MHVTLSQENVGEAESLWYLNIFHPQGLASEQVDSSGRMVGSDYMNKNILELGLPSALERPPRIF